MTPSYVSGILAQGNCPALVKGGVFSSQGRTFFAWDRSGLVRIRGAVRREAQEKGCSSAKAFLAMAARAASSSETADDWLIPPECLDLSTENVWYDPSGKRVLFCLAEHPEAYECPGTDRTRQFFAFLLQLSALEAPAAYPYVEKLSKRAEEEHLSFAAIKKELSRRLTGLG